MLKRTCSAISLPWSQVDESVDLTALWSTGTYYYGACVQAVTGESDTTNNCSASVQVDVEVPDLEVGSPSVDDASPGTGGSFTLSATVTNAGDGASASTTLHYYRSSDATITSADAQVGTDSVGALAAGATSDESVDLTAPASVGTNYYGACVQAVTGELDATNNCSASVRVDVQEPTLYLDLEVGSPSVDDASPETGGSFTLSATVTNAGDGASASTRMSEKPTTAAEGLPRADAGPALPRAPRIAPERVWQRDHPTRPARGTARYGLEEPNLSTDSPLGTCEGVTWVRSRADSSVSALRNSIRLSVVSSSSRMGRSRVSRVTRISS